MDGAEIVTRGSPSAGTLFCRSHGGPANRIRRSGRGGRGTKAGAARTANVSTMATYMNQYGRESGNFGFGSAVAVVMFIISLILALAYQRFVLRRDTEGALTGGRSIR